MKICALSDIHGDLPATPICDVLIIAGDILPLDIQGNRTESVAWLAGPFQKWCLSRKCKHVILIAGNHDFIFADLYRQWRGPRQIHDILFKADKNLKIHYLQDTHVNIDGKIFYGTPWCPELKNWAFYGDSEQLVEKFSDIPNCDVLITHCPPKVGTQGVVLQENNWNIGRNFGCQELTDAIQLSGKKIDWVISGHIHSGNHEVEKWIGTNYVNVSIKNEDYYKTYKPFVFEI
jgi:Icc-related predicted phosphoesterase